MAAKADKLKHVQVREYVRTLVHQAEPGTPAPSERELVQRFGVARMTVRQALDSLVSQGLLERIPGRGTFVAKPHVDMQARLSSFSEEMERRGRKATSRTLLRRRETAGPGVARALQVEEGHPIVHWQRLRLSDDVPACISDTYLSLELFPDALSVPEPESLYQWFGDQNLMPTWGEDSVMADVLADAEATHLEVESGQPALRISRRAYCREQVCEVSRSVYRADQFTVWVPVLRAEFER